MSFSTVNKIQGKETVSIEVPNNPLGNAQSPAEVQHIIKHNSSKNYIVSEDMQVFEETKKEKDHRVQIGKSNSFPPKQANQVLQETIEQSNLKTADQKETLKLNAQLDEFQDDLQSDFVKKSPAMRDRGKSVLIKLLQKEKEVNERRTSKDMTTAIGAFIKAAKPPIGK